MVWRGLVWSDMVGLDQQTLLGDIISICLSVLERTYAWAYLCVLVCAWAYLCVLERTCVYLNIPNSGLIWLVNCRNQPKLNCYKRNLSLIYWKNAIFDSFQRMTSTHKYAQVRSSTLKHAQVPTSTHKHKYAQAYRNYIAYCRNGLFWLVIFFYV